MSNSLVGETHHSSTKKTVYVGGLAEDVDTAIVKTSFEPFGDIVDISLPLDYSSQKHRGFAFVEFQAPEDAADAIDNMDNGEILGKTVRVSLAKPMRIKEGSTKPIWADDEYLRKYASGDPPVETTDGHQNETEAMDAD